MKRPASRVRGSRLDTGSRPASSSATPGPAWLASPAFVWVSLALLTLAALALRWFALRYQPTVTFDGTEYIRYAEALKHGERFASVFAPGYPVLVALASVLHPDRVGAAVAVSMVAGIALPAIVWWLARGLLGERGALLPALVCALHPELARHSAISMSESAYIGMLFFGLAQLAALRAGPAIIGGLALGLAYAIRPEGLVAAVALAFAGIRKWASDSSSRRAMLAAAVGSALVVIACVLWYHATLGVWTLTPKTAALHEAARDWRAAEPVVGAAVPEAPQLTHSLLASLAAWPANAWRHAQALLWSWPWPLLLLSLWGLTQRRGIETAALVYLPLLPFLGLSQQGRFALAAIPALAISASVVLVTESSRWRRAMAVALAVFGVVATTWALGDAFRTPFDGGGLTDKRAGEWLSSVATPGDAVVDRKPFVAFYAKCRHRVLAEGSYDALVDDMVANGARWLVLEDYVVRQMRPQFAPLLDSEEHRARESRLEMVYARADAGGGSLAIFRVLVAGEAKQGRPPVVELEGFPGRSVAP